MVALVSVITALVAGMCGTPCGFLAGILAGGFLGFINGFNVAFFGIQPVIATLAMLNFARGLAFQLTGGTTVTGMPEGFSFLGSSEFLGIPYRIYLALLVLLVGQFFLSNHKIGRSIFAIGGDEEAARYSGIPIRRYVLLSYVIAGALAALSALVITSRANSGQPTIGVFMELKAIAAVVIGGTSLGGGRGSLWRTTGGALVITVLNNGMNLAGVSPYLQEMTIGLVIIAAVFIDNFQRGKGVDIRKLIQQFGYIKKT
jgi:ribose transport system permease protein